MPAAVLTARAEAKQLREKVGSEHVFAYGSSAGGTLAALLSGESLVSAAVARHRSPISSPGMAVDRVRPEYFERIDLSLAARYGSRPCAPGESPLLIYQGRDDQVVRRR